MTSYGFEVEAVSGEGAPAGVVVARLRGEIDATNVPEVEQELARRAGGRGLIVDLNSVEYFDSAAFAMLYRMLAMSDLRVVIAAHSVLRPAAELISLPMYESVEDAAAGG
jgi:anti-anti-sigma factor